MVRGRRANAGMGVFLMGPDKTARHPAPPTEPRASASGPPILTANYYSSEWSSCN